jgi:mono/diheme cytochrome c family protein
VTRALLAFIALFSAAPLAAQSAGQWRGPEQIWGATCGYCHGAGVAPELRGRKLDPQATAFIARNGLPGMPVFKPSEINDAELDQLAHWIALTPSPAKAPRPGK